MRVQNKLSKSIPFLWGLVILACVLSFVLRLPSFDFPLDWDVGGHYFYGMQAATKGFFSVFWDMRTVGIVFVFALIYKIFSSSIIGIYIIGSLFWICSTFFIYRLAKLLFDSRIGVLTALIFALFSSSRAIQGEMVNSEVFIMLPTLMGIYFFFKARERKDWRFFALSGILFGVAFTIKQVIIFDMLALLTYSLIFLYRDFKKEVNLFIKSNLILAFSFLVPISLFALYFFLTNRFNDFYYWQFTKALKNNSAYHLFGSGINNFVLNFSQIFKKTYPVWLIFFGGLITTAFHFRAIKRVFFLFWIFWVFLGMYFLWWFFPHHFLQLTPPISILAGLFLSDLLSFGYSSLKSQWFIFKNRAIYFCLFFGLILFLKGDSPYFVGYIKKLRGEINKTQYLAMSGFDIGPEGWLTLYETADYLKQKTKPEETMYFWGTTYYIYALAGKQPISWFVYKHPLVPDEQRPRSYKGWFSNMEESRRKMMDGLYKEFPNYIVIWVQPETIFDEMFSFSEFSNFIVNNYVFEKQIGNILVYKRAKEKVELGDNIVVPLEVVKRYSAITNIGINKERMETVFEPMVNPNGVLRSFKSIYPYLEEVKIIPQIPQLIEIGKEDFVGYGIIKPSGTSDFHLRVKGLSKPVSFIRIKIGNFSWNSQSYGVNPIIKVEQTGDIFDLYFEPVSWQGKQKMEIYFIYEDGDLAKAEMEVTFK